MFCDGSTSFDVGQSSVQICGECQTELKQISALRNRLQESDLFEPASPQLADRIRQQIAQETIAHETRESRAKVFSLRRPFLIQAFGAFAAAAAAIAVVFLVFQSRSQETRITAELIDAHVRSLQPGHLTDVLSTDQHTVKPWFDGKLDFIPPVTDFSQQGFPLVGGRLDIIDGRDVAALVYGRRKHFINVFVWPYREKEPSLFNSNLANSGSRQGYNWLCWQSGEMEFCLISDASPTDLRQLRDLIRE